MKLQYTTQGVEAARRFDYWNEVVCRHCIPATSRMLTSNTFDAALSVSSVGTVSVSRMSAPLHQWRRDAHHIRTGPDDDLWLGFMLGGEGQVSQDGREVQLRDGDMTLYDATRPFEFALAPEAICLVRLPRKALLSRLPSAERMMARLIDKQRPGALALRSMVLEATTANFTEPEAAARYGSALLDVLALTIGTSPDARSDTHERDLYNRLAAYIREHYADPGLNLGSLAQAHHVSERTVTRAFAHHNQTPMEALRRARLEESHRALCEGKANTVTSAALDCGFTDLSHFSRIFKTTYGCTPQSLLLHTGTPDKSRTHVK